MNSLSIFSKSFAIPVAFVLATHINVQAQNPVESTHIDEKYAYTTVVYKNTAATDKDVLSSLENDFSIGDVVRVTLAPPPAPIAASEPVYADKSKGEDAWMPGSTKAVQNLTVSANLTTAPKTSINTIVSAPKPAKIADRTAAPKPVIVAKTMATAQEQGKTVAPAPVQGQKAEATAVPTTSSTGTKLKSSTSGKSAKAHKSSKKSDKKSGQKKKLKNRKQGKQRYSCPKF